MGLYSPVMNEGFVPAYQASAIPYVSSSVISAGEIHTYNFPQVTRFINVQNVGTSVTDEIAVAFTLNGLSAANSNFFSLSQGVSFRDELRTNQLFISCSSGTSMRYQLVAGLTNIPANQFMTITGSSGYQGVG
jgi:hypothetical protein